jgi:glycosyltransferase involved in cell wall biosynthesis
MKVGLVVTGGLDPSGRERVTPALLWLVERLARRHELHAFVLRYFRQPRTYPLLGATVHDLGRVDGPPGLGRYRMAQRLRAAVARHGPFDLLHAYFGLPPGFAATRVGRSLGIPTVVTFDSGELTAIDDIEYGQQRRWLDRAAIRSTIRRADRLLVPTHAMAAQAARHGVQPAVVPIGVDASRFPLAARVDGPPWRLLRVGSINRVKDHPTLLHAVARLAGLADIHLDIVGEDTVHGAAQALAARLGVERRVTFHGAQPTERVAELYARAHLHVVSSRHEASCVAVLEAAATGLPTVGTDVGYVADWAVGRAVAVPIGDPAALAGAMADLLHDPARRRTIADAARAWTLAHDADWTAEQLHAIYTDLMRST